MELIEHAALGGRQVVEHAMEKERRLVEEPFGGPDILDDNALGQMFQSGVFRRGEFLACEDDDRKVSQCRILLHSFKQVESRDVGQPEVDDAAVEGVAVQDIERLHTGAYCSNVDIVMVEQFDNALSLDIVVFHDKQALLVWSDIRSDPV